MDTLHMDHALGEYLPVLIFLILSLVIGCLFVFVNFVVARHNPDDVKNSAYECGFDQFGDSRMKFDVRFYLVTLLFIIFDLEVVFLFPWAITFGSLGLFGYLSMMMFLTVLTIGFIDEWKKGALEWQ